MALFLQSPSAPPNAFSASEEGQYRLGVHQAMRRIVGFLGNQGITVVTVDADYTIHPDDSCVRVDTTSGDVNVSLPPVAGLAGRMLYLKKVSTDGNTLTVTADGAETIDGSGTLAWTTAYQAYTLIANTTGWDIL